MGCVVRPDQARARIDRLRRAQAGDDLALDELVRAKQTGIDPILLQGEPPAEEVAATRSAAAKKAWATRRAAGWIHPRSRSS